MWTALVLVQIGPLYVSILDSIFNFSILKQEFIFYLASDVDYASNVPTNSCVIPYAIERDPLTPRYYCSQEYIEVSFFNKGYGFICGFFDFPEVSPVESYVRCNLGRRLISFNDLKIN